MCLLVSILRLTPKHTPQRHIIETSIYNLNMTFWFWNVIVDLVVVDSMISFWSQRWICSRWRQVNYSKHQIQCGPWHYQPWPTSIVLQSLGDNYTRCHVAPSATWQTMKTTLMNMAHPLLWHTESNTKLKGYFVSR